MADQTVEMTPQRNYWISGNLKTVATGLTGVIAIFVALKATAYSAGDVVGLDDHIFRTVAFASLTVWVALTIGLRRSGAAAIIVLGMATFIEQANRRQPGPSPVFPALTLPGGAGECPPHA